MLQDKNTAGHVFTVPLLEARRAEGVLVLRHFSNCDSNSNWDIAPLHAVVFLTELSQLQWPHRDHICRYDLLQTQKSSRENNLTTTQLFTQLRGQNSEPPFIIHTNTTFTPIHPAWSGSENCRWKRHMQKVGFHFDQTGLSLKKLLWCHHVSPFFHAAEHHDEGFASAVVCSRRVWSIQTRRQLGRSWADGAKLFNRSFKTSAKKTEHKPPNTPTVKQYKEVQHASLCSNNITTSLKRGYHYSTSQTCFPASFQYESAEESPL